MAGEGTISLRQAQREDLAAVAALHRLSYFDAMPEMPRLHTLEETIGFYEQIVWPRDEIWLAVEGGGAEESLVGFIAFRPGWVEQLYVDPAHQGRGVGSRLLARAMAGAETLRLWTFERNVPARRFYAARGFDVERTTDGADNEEGEPDILFRWTRAAFGR
ncbi:MAG: GNAT family N-acetyltransferase [Acidobacteriota bacterium]